MPRLAAALVCFTLTTTACRPTYAPTARRVGMVTSIAGVVGLMATAVVQSYTTRTDDMLTGFSLLSGGGILLFAAGDLADPETAVRRETETEKFSRWARILTSRAAGAAREGRCPRVRRLEKRVHLYDREVHDFVFMRDAAILTCLDGATPGVEPSAAEEPTSPLPLTAPDAPPAESDSAAPADAANPANPPSAAPTIPPPGGTSPQTDPANPPPTLPPPDEANPPPTLPPPTLPPPTLPPPRRDPPNLRLPTP